MMRTIARRMLVPGAQVVMASLAAVALRLYFVLQFPADAGDSGIYEEIAHNWLESHVYGLFFPRDLTPTDIRLPGYPAFLAILYLIGRRRIIVFLAQAAIDVGTCYLTALLAWLVAPTRDPRQRSRIVIPALWISATCPFLANYSAVVLTEVLATFLTAAALIPLSVACSSVDSLQSETAHDGSPNRRWFIGGLFVGLGTLVRPETPLVLIALALVLIVRWRRRKDWRKLLQAGALTAAGLLLPLLPWGVRNWVRFHEIQFLAPKLAASREEFTPLGFYAWTRTWLVRYRDVYLVPWNLGTARIEISDIPPTAFDSAQERARVAELLDRYNATNVITPEIDRQFAEIARERTARHPLRTYFVVPFERIGTLWFTPRVELLPVSGHLWPIRQQWNQDRADFSITLVLGALNFLYVGMAAAGVWRLFAPRRNIDGDPDLWTGASLAHVFLLVFIVVRSVFLTTVETPEPRYVLECLPALFVFAAMTWLPRSAKYVTASGLPVRQAPAARGVS